MHEEIAAEVYVHEEPLETHAIAAEAYTHTDIAAEPYEHEDPVESHSIAAEPYTHVEVVAEPYEAEQVRTGRLSHFFFSGNGTPNTKYF